MFDSTSEIFAHYERLDDLWRRAYTQQRFAPDITVPCQIQPRDFLAMRVFLTESISLNLELVRRFPEFSQLPLMEDRDDEGQS